MVDTCLNAHRHSHKSLSGSSAVIFPKYNSIEDDQNAGTGGREVMWMGTQTRIVPERWSYSDTEDYGILKGYLENTFKRLYEEGKVWEKETYAIFNTGLFNHYYQPIYAYFIPNLVPDRQPWFLDGFYTEYYLLKQGITVLPEKASYVDDPSDLVFDTKIPVVPQYEHIFGDEENAARLPREVRDSSMRLQLFDGALKQTKRMLEADYKTAIPQYYNHSIQLLIPLCLRSPGVPDLALACMKTPDGSKYLGRTCLTLRMAYHNARLLARVDNSWLTGS